MSSAMLVYESPDFEIFTSIRGDAILVESEFNTELSIIGQPSPFYMLRYHRDRLLAAAKQFGWAKAVQALDDSAGLLLLERRLFEHLELDPGNFNVQCPIKVCYISSDHLPAAANHNLPPPQLRALFSPSGHLTITSMPTPPLSLSTLFPTTLPRFVESPTWRIFVSPHSTLATLHTIHKTTFRDSYNSSRSLIPPSPSSDLPDEILLINADGDVMEGSITTPYFWRGGRWITPATSSGGNLGTTRRWALERGLCVEGQVKGGELDIGEGVWLSNGVRGWGWGRIEDLKGESQRVSV
ncbi:hypothetical protein MMC07_005415 [Pseudocyphellaria aurata]|nr:hypothetical protein [Pseudocyphellaria aurata]